MELTENQQEILNAMFAGTDHTGESLVEQGFAVEAVFTRLNELEEKLKSKVPVCPHCLAEMKKVSFVGYYDKMSFWECDCEWNEKDEDVESRRGAYSYF